MKKRVKNELAVFYVEGETIQSFPRSGDDADGVERSGRVDLRPG